LHRPPPRGSRTSPAHRPYSGACRPTCVGRLDWLSTGKTMWSAIIAECKLRLSPSRARAINAVGPRSGDRSRSASADRRHPGNGKARGTATSHAQHPARIVQAVRGALNSVNSTRSSCARLPPMRSSSSAMGSRASIAAAKSPCSKEAKARDTSERGVPRDNDHRLRARRSVADAPPALRLGPATTYVNAICMSEKATPARGKAPVAKSCMMCQASVSRGYPASSQRHRNETGSVIFPRGGPRCTSGANASWKPVHRHRIGGLEVAEREMPIQVTV
jgi:hypothetical protein